jgi:YhcH/YjgK/YiaL family protein
MGNHAIIRLPLFLLLILTTVGMMNCSQTPERKQMIMGRLEQADDYLDMHPAFAKAFAFLRQDNLAELKEGRHEIDGDRLYALVIKVAGRTREEANLEAHRKNIDIHYTVSGTDEIGWKPTAECTETDTAYDEESDAELFSDEPQIWTEVPTGSFAIFFPEDTHAPGVSDGDIHKVVLKVAVE